MTLAALEAVKDLRRAFASRSMQGHSGTGTIQVHQVDERRIFVVLDPQTSRQVLCSSTVENQNYFAGNLLQLQNRGRALKKISSYFEESPLFREGADHRRLRAQILPILHESCASLRQQTPTIVERARRRLDKACSPLDIATHVVEHCFVQFILGLVNVPLSNALRAIRCRSSVFYFHFHPGRHRQMNDALECLAYCVDPSAIEQSRLRWNIAESLLVMGVDPSIAAITAAIIDDQPGPFSEGIQRYAPTSFVSRVCTARTDVGPYSAQAGDVCYLALIGPNNESLPTIPFGAGAHVCIGKPVSILVCEIAEQVYRALPESSRPRQALDASGDGAFLSFKAGPP